MQPRAKRSRACDQCRSRRVKCDETPVTCQQCQRLGLQCGGPVQGSVIIDMSARVSKPQERKKKAPKAPVAQRQETAEQTIASEVGVVPKFKPRGSTSPLPIILAPSHKLTNDEKIQRDAEQSIAAIRWQYKFPKLYQPAHIQPLALDMAFISHFVELHKGAQSFTPEIPFLTHLPNLHSKASKAALRLSIRAASMAFYAKVHKDTTILVDSYKWYTRSLASQRLSLDRLVGSQNIPTEEEVLVPILLSLYETYAGTTTTSILTHLQAVTSMLSMRGPRNCCPSSGIVNPLFRAWRVTDSHRAVLLNHPSCFSSKDWMTIPFEDTSRNAPQFLADILLQVPHVMSLCQIPGSMRDFFEGAIPARVDLRPCREQAQTLLRDLDDWARQFPHLINATGTQRIVSLDMSSVQDDSKSSRDPRTLVLPPSFIALTAAIYEAVRLILSLLLDKVSSSSRSSTSSATSSERTASSYSPVPNLVDMAAMSSRSIIEITQYLESTRPVGFDFVRSVFPLAVAAILGPRSQEKKEARHMLERWAEKRGMGGLATVFLHV